MYNIVLDGVVGYEITADSIRNQLKEAKGEDINLEISSPGGSVFEGLTVYRLLMKYKRDTGAKITADILSLAASMGSVIPLVADEIKVYNTSVYMIHNAWGVGVGNHNDLREIADMLESLTNMLVGIYEEKTGKSKDELKALLDNETFFYGEEIVNNGFADVLEQDESNKNELEEVQFAKMAVEEAQNRFSNQQKRDDLEKAVALFKTPVQQVSNKMEEKVYMNLNEYLDDNPEAKAEFDSKLKTAMAEGKESALKADRENTKEILALAGIKLSDNLENCITNGLSAKDYAYNEVKMQREKVSTDKVEFGKIEGKTEIVDAKDEKGTEKFDSILDAFLKDGK